MAGCRPLDWFLVKRTLRGKFHDVDWITTQQLAEWLADKERPAPVLLDVRTPEEWNVSHLANARRVDPKATAQETAGNLSKDTPIVAYCSVGYRSGLGRTAVAGRGIHARAGSGGLDFSVGERRAPTCA